MAFEIDYIPVGEGDKGGDCIAMRFWDPLIGLPSQKVVVIDGGYKDTAELLINLVRNVYGTGKIDLIVSTHPDMDHVSGLLPVIEEMEVSDLIIHKPWEHAQDIKREFLNGKLTVSGIRKDLEESLSYASDLENLAIKKGITISEPFAGMTGFDGKMHVLGPSKEYYQELLPQFRGTPEPKKSIGLLGMIGKAGQEVKKFIQDQIHINHLDDEDSTSPENNSSTIILFEIDGHKILFTGDAGKRAIEKAIVYAHSQGIILNDLRVFDVPHHGSKRNLGKAMMEHIQAEYAYISAPINSEKHPAGMVTNHLFKKGTRTFATQGRHVYHFHGVDLRPGWSYITPIPFQNEIEL